MFSIRHTTATARLILAGAFIAALAGAQAGAALRPEPTERGPAAAPQQIFLDGQELASVEQAGDGWPVRAMFLEGVS